MGASLSEWDKGSHMTTARMEHHRRVVETKERWGNSSNSCGLCVGKERERESENSICLEVGVAQRR